MLYYILDEALDIVDVFETYKSVIWTTRYFDSGDCEFYLPAMEKTIDLLRKDRYIVPADDTTQAMIIRNIQVTTDVEEGNYLIVTGKSLSSILSRRIIWNQTVLNGNVETCVRQLVNENAIDTGITARNIPQLILGTQIGLTDTIKKQFTGTNLEEAVQEICKTYGIGYDVLLDLENKQFIFILYKGADRSYNQDENPHVVFSDEFENLLSTDYTLNTDNYRNVVKIAGEGEGTARRYASVGYAEGLARFEKFVDSRDVSSNEGEIDESTYLLLLAEEGQKTLAEMTVEEILTGEIINNYMYKVNVDYFLGDIVQVVNFFGKAMTPRVTEIIESEDETGHHIIPSFSTD